MGYDGNPNGSDLMIVTDVLQYGVFATLPIYGGCELDIPAGDCDCDGNVLDVCGECGGDGVDADEDGICDDVDDCVGAYDFCGVCNGDNYRSIK